MALVAALGALVWWAQTPRPSRAEFRRVELHSSSRSEVAAALEAAELLEAPTLFAVYATVLEPWATPQPGVHWLPRGASPQALSRLVARRGPRPQQRVLLPEGIDVFQIAERLQKAGICHGSDFISAARPGEPDLTAEGSLYPATYDLYLDTPAEVVLAKLQAEAQRRWTPLFAELAAEVDHLRGALNLTQRDIVTLASMVEREAAKAEELGPIARVFLNRLDNLSFRPRGMLQSDPTAAYGCRLQPELESCKDFSGRVTPTMLRDPANRYNTYRHPGLPPGPIANPGAAALRAVLRAPASDHLFFVADGRGGHRFSHTLEEHRQATDQLRRLRPSSRRDGGPPAE